jgi:hypothetical protein
MNDNRKLNSMYSELLLEISQKGGRALAMRTDEYVCQLVAAFQDRDTPTREATMTEADEDRNYWTNQRVDAVNAALSEAEIRLEDVRELLAEMANPSPDPRTVATA